MSKYLKYLICSVMLGSSYPQIVYAGKKSSAATTEVKAAPQEKNNDGKQEDISPIRDAFTKSEEESDEEAFEEVPNVSSPPDNRESSAQSFQVSIPEKPNSEYFSSPEPPSWTEWYNYARNIVDNYQNSAIINPKKVPSLTYATFLSYIHSWFPDKNVDTLKRLTKGEFRGKTFEFSAPQYVSSRRGNAVFLISEVYYGLITGTKDNGTYFKEESDTPYTSLINMLNYNDALQRQLDQNAAFELDENACCKPLHGKHRKTILTLRLTGLDKQNNQWKHFTIVGYRSQKKFPEDFLEKYAKYD